MNMKNKSSESSKKKKYFYGRHKSEFSEFLITDNYGICNKKGNDISLLVE